MRKEKNTRRRRLKDCAKRQNDEKEERERESAFLRFCRCSSPAFDVLLSLLKSSSAPFKASLRLRHFFLSLLKTVGHPRFFSTRRATTLTKTSNLRKRHKRRAKKLKKLLGQKEPKKKTQREEGALHQKLTN
tara:strand:- start:86 stop:481 length:396 start_codon:yes stop_codon:yes gene_type:complete